MSDNECRLAGRIAVITGAGRGVGRQHAHFFARQGAQVVVNDIGSTETDDGQTTRTADTVVKEITDEGGSAVASYDNIATWDGAKALIDTALDNFGDVNVLINNAGMTRHMPFTMISEETWDAVFNVNLKSVFMTLRHAAEYWRKKSEAGQPVAASVVNTTSRGALYARAAKLFQGNPGMLPYGVAKAGVATLTEVAARELADFGVRVNTISPSARGMLSPWMMTVKPTTEDFDDWDPANISPLVGWLSQESCPITGHTFWIKGGRISMLNSWHTFDVIDQGRRWTMADLDEIAPRLATAPEEDIPST